MKSERSTVYNNLYKDEVTQQRGWLLSSFLLTVALIDKTDFEIFFFLTYAKGYIFYKLFYKYLQTLQVFRREQEFYT